MSVSSSINLAASTFSVSLGVSPGQQLNICAQCIKLRLDNPLTISVGLMQGGTFNFLASLIIFFALSNPSN